jgi:hypothetical protein
MVKRTRDRSQRPKDLTAAQRRTQLDTQEEVADRTYWACQKSRDVETQGTFAHDVFHGVGFE